MMKLEAIIRAERLENVRNALLECEISGMTISEVYGSGSEPAPEETYRGNVYRPAYTKRIKLELLVDDERLEYVAGAIARSARTGHPGDGKVFAYPVDQTIQIRTGEIAYGTVAARTVTALDLGRSHARECA